MKIIKDRHAKTENVRGIASETRITMEELHGQNQDIGKTLEEIHGSPKDPGRRATGGVPTNMPGAADDAPKDIVTATCTATTLKGEACRAYPMSGFDICIGHARQ